MTQRGTEPDASSHTACRHLHGKRRYRTFSAKPSTRQPERVPLVPVADRMTSRVHPPKYIRSSAASSRLRPTGIGSSGKGRWPGPRRCRWRTRGPPPTSASVRGQLGLTSADPGVGLAVDVGVDAAAPGRPPDQRRAACSGTTSGSPARAAGRRSAAGVPLGVDPDLGDPPGGASGGTWSGGRPAARGLAAVRGAASPSVRRQRAGHRAGGEVVAAGLAEQCAHAGVPQFGQVG